MTLFGGRKHGLVKIPRIGGLPRAYCESNYDSLRWSETRTCEIFQNWGVYPAHTAAGVTVTGASGGASATTDRYCTAPDFSVRRDAGDGTRPSVEESSVYRRTNPPVEGLVSIDRSVVAALLGTTPRLVPKSSANDLALELCTGSSEVGRDGPRSRGPGDGPLLRR